MKINHKICCSRSTADVFSIVKFDSLNISVTIIFVVYIFCVTCLKTIVKQYQRLSFFSSNMNFWCSSICSNFLKTKTDSLNISITDRFIQSGQRICCSKFRNPIELENDNRQFRQFLQQFNLNQSVTGSH